jgi:hypothetical protein
MSVFTGFDAVEQLQYDLASSRSCDKDLWKLVPGFRYYIGREDSDSYVDVPTGFLTDGATIPRFLWWLLPPLGEYSQATTLHDWLCSTYRITRVINGVPTQVSITRKEIDGILAEAMNVLTVTPWKKFVINTGVDLYRIVKNPTTPKPVAVPAH